MLPDWAKKPLVAVGTLKIDFGSLLLFGLLFDSLLTTLGDLRRVLAGYCFRPAVAKSFDSQ